MEKTWPVREENTCLSLKICEQAFIVEKTCILQLCCLEAAAYTSLLFVRLFHMLMKEHCMLEGVWSLYS